ncbi:uncharacterized protein RCH25_025905 [Pelodytes ibericus]
MLISPKQQNLNIPPKLFSTISCELHPLAFSVNPAGVSNAFLIEVPQKDVWGFVGGSVLLPVYYHLPDPPPTLRITWVHEKSIVLFSEMTICPPDPAALALPHTMCHKYHIALGGYKQRAHFFPKNGSLLLHNLRLKDSGHYWVTFSELNQTRSLTLHLQNPGTNSPALHSTSSGMMPSVVDMVQQEQTALSEGGFSLKSLVIRCVCLVFFLLVVLGLHCEWWRKYEDSQANWLHYDPKICNKDRKKDTDPSKSDNLDKLQFSIDCDLRLYRKPRINATHPLTECNKY